MVQNKRMLFDTIRSGLVDCDMQSAIGMLCLLAGIPLYLWGRPGTGKSMLARRLLSLVRNSVPANKETLKQEHPGPHSLLLIDDLNWQDSTEVTRLKILTESHNWQCIVATGGAMPESSLHAVWQDFFAIRLPMPDLTHHSQLNKLLTGTAAHPDKDLSSGLLDLEELTEFQNAIDRVELSTECSVALNALFSHFLTYNKELDQGNIGWPVDISPRRWKSLARLLRAHAALEGRSRVEFLDCLLLGAPVWGNGGIKEVAGKGFDRVVDSYVNEIASGLHQWGNRLPMLKPEIHRALNASPHLFKTVSVAHADCIEFRVVLGYDHLTLFAPAHFIGTQEDFVPWKEGGKEEPRLRCNFNGTITCKILVDAGARQKVYRASSIQASAYEEYGSFTAEILVKDHEMTMEKNTERLDALRKEVQSGLELYASGLAELKKTAQDKSLVNGGSLIPKEILHHFREILMNRFDQFRNEAQELNHLRKLLSESA